MSVIWSKFFWSDWQSEPALRLCSYAARGLWMDMLCIAAAHDPIGYVAVAGRGLDETAIARMTGGSESEVSVLLGELDRNGVFSRDRQGRIYSRRMVADARRAAIARKNGKLGGNPSLGKNKGKARPDNPADKGGLKPQEPEAIIQKEEEDADASSVGSASPRPTAKAPGEPWLKDADFMAAWNACTEQGRTRSSRRKAWAEWRKHPASGPEKLAGLKAYLARDPDVKRTGGPGFHLWLRDKLDEWLGAAQDGGQTTPAAWTGPESVVRLMERAFGPEKGRGYLAAYCTWQEVPFAALLVSSPIIADMICKTAIADFEEMGARVLVKGRAA